MRIVRAIVLAGWGVAVVAGVLMMAGVFVPRSLPGEYGIPLGAVVSLYGMFRFVVTYTRRQDGGEP